MKYGYNIIYSVKNRYLLFICLHPDFPNFLMTPSQQKLYYTPEMKGSYSIKNVLPALVTEFTYANLEINNGGDASLAFESLLKKTDPMIIKDTRKNLLAYCRLDTLAMVEILMVLKLTI